MRRLRRVGVSGAVVAVAAACAWLAGGGQHAARAQSAVPPGRIAEQMLLGNPSNAVRDAGEPRNYLIQRPQYALSVNRSTGQPNWVSWRLCRPDIGRAGRGQFAPDPDLGPGFTRVLPAQYSGTGYTRGHMCPSGDRSATRADNDATFYMSNIVLQAEGLNAGPWNDLEIYCRELARAGNELYIVSGPTGGRRRTRSGLLIPEATWKVALVLPDRAGDDLERVTAQTRVIAVLMPNHDGVAGTDWRNYRLSVADIEEQTKLVFFTNLPADKRAALKRGVDDR